MIHVPAHKVRQFGVEFYQTSFTSGDIQKLLKFEVLNYPAIVEEGMLQIPEDPGIMRCLDGQHRLLALREDGG